MMANNPKVRERLAKLGIDIPSDTHFLAGQMDTTTDAVQLFDLEDVPPTHRADLARLQEDLKEASALTRNGVFPAIRPSWSAGGNSRRGWTSEDECFSIRMIIAKTRAIDCSKSC
jgi:hypothetical protein